MVSRDLVWPPEHYRQAPVTIQGGQAPKFSVDFVLQLKHSLVTSQLLWDLHVN